ncbi:uncharacterized protein with PQ loop repeat [Cytobacillus eiseniae]|uniref:Uncharacterized protein with PQ loop repeat n=1 Tax=Cytobacillus eiseniae TaxID=762947 RepID=A0ABS4RK41_9BACI|nr:YxlC family protein [Cytobacillus eiseniae]MBP2243279.1 uncharacterized protein with PQ loop repeat [Cytobacillus eiseniae]
MKQIDEETQLEKLKHDWEQLDELAENHSTSNFEMKQQIEVFQEKQKKGFYKELLIFFVTAICILSFFTISIVQAPVLFIVIEICAMMIGPIVFYILVKRKKKEREAHL